MQSDFKFKVVHQAGGEDAHCAEGAALGRRGGWGRPGGLQAQQVGAGQAAVRRRLGSISVPACQHPSIHPFTQRGKPVLEETGGKRVGP